MAITAETRTDIIDLVVAALDVAPGTTLLSELVAIVDGGGTLADVAANLTARTDYLAKYPTFQTANEWATEWLGNLIPEADAATMAAAVTIAEGMINSGSTQAAIIVEAASFLAAATADATYGTVATAFVNNSSVAAYHTITKEEADIGTSTLTGVDSTDASVTSAKATLDVVAPVAGSTFTLTTGVDTGASFTGGAGADTYAATAISAGKETLTSGDSLTGGEGTDRLTLTSSVAGTYGNGAIGSSIEELQVTATAATVVDATLMTSVTDIYNVGSTTAGTLSVTGAAAIPNVHMTGSNGNTTVSFVDMGQDHILRKRIKCNLELDCVSKETGISAKLIRAIEKSDKRPFSSVLSYKMTERKLDTYYSVKLNMGHKENKIPSFLRPKIGS
jgi:hypothetical protein